MTTLLVAVPVRGPRSITLPKGIARTHEQSTEKQECCRDHSDAPVTLVVQEAAVVNLHRTPLDPQARPCLRGDLAVLRQGSGGALSRSSHHFSQSGRHPCLDIQVARRHEDSIVTRDGRRAVPAVVEWTLCELRVWRCRVPCGAKFTITSQTHLMTNPSTRVPGASHCTAAS